MTDSNPLFSSLDDGAGGGVALHKVLEGDAAAAKNASPALVAKDESGNLIYLKVNALGQLSTTSDTVSGNCKGGHLTKTAGSTSRTQVGADISLVAGKALSSLEWAFYNYRSTEYEIIIVDDPAGTPVETTVMEALCSEGSASAIGRQVCLDDIDTTGMTTPVMRVFGTNLNKASDFRARVTVQEAA